MACKLNTEQALQVYSLLYKDIMEGTEPININSFVRELYELVDDKDKALLYAQAVPDILNLVSQDESVIEKLVENDFDFNGLAKMRVQFNDLNNVAKAVVEKKRTKPEIEAEIKEKNTGSKEQSSKPVEEKDEKIVWSYNENNGAKIVFPFATTTQMAYSANPEEVSDWERNNLDPEKKLFYDVIKDIVYIARQRESDSTDVIYDGVSLTLHAMRTSDVPISLLTADDRKFREDNPSYEGIVTVVSDTEGRPVYFDDNGRIVEEGQGRIVYTYLRQVNLVKGKLLLSNRSKYSYNLVEPEIIAARLIKEMEAQPKAKKVTKEFFEQKVKEIREKQEYQLNALYNLRNFLLEGENTVLLPITGGSFGIQTTKGKPMSLSQAGLTLEDVKRSEQITAGPKKGYQMLMVSRKKPGVTIDQQVFFQRGDMTSELADKIADVLTTKAKLNGRELTPEQRQAYFEVFVNNSIPQGQKMNRDRITAKMRVIENVPKLIVTIKGEAIPEEDLYTEETRDLIKTHLMNAVDFKGVRTYPANVHYNFSYQNENFTDYTVSGDTITSESKKYFDFISPFMKIEFQDLDNAYFNGLNAYLNYSIPENLIPPGEQVYQVGRPVDKTKTDIEKRFEKEKSTKKDKEAPKVKKKKVKAKKPETKKQAVEENPATKVNLLSDIINQPGRKLNDSQKLNREKSYLREVFKSKKDLKAAETWWANSPLSKYIELTRITEIVNSDAYATWQNFGITLYEGDGGTALDVYHEAWHGFSQLFLTKKEKISLYNELMKNDKWKNKTFLEIEEDLAESFRTYAISKGKQKREGVVGRIFRKVYNFLKSLFKGVTRQDLINKPTDIPVVKELFEKLYRASDNPAILSNLTPSMNNIIFTELNRSKTINQNFSIDESIKTSAFIDNLISNEIRLYNSNQNTTAGGLKILKNTDQKIALYTDVYDKIVMIREAYREQYDDIIERNFEAANPDVVTEKDLLDKLDLLDKIIDNYGDPVDAFESTTIQENVIAYNIEKSVYKVLGDTYIEIEDPTNLESTELFKRDSGNTISSRELASQDTLMLLASIIKISKDENGNPVQELDFFGIPQIASLNDTWNRLAKILQGSFDEQDMYNRIMENSNNYPEMQQLLSLLPNPAENFSEGAEFDLETAFWQDFKKPRIPYIQLNFQSNKDDQDTYGARMARANFDVYQVRRDWEVNFKVSDSTTNPYVTKEKTRPLLNLRKVINEFGTNGQFKYNRANEFLKAVGIELDMSSVAIQNIVNNKQNNFAIRFGIDQIYKIIQDVDKSTDKKFKYDFALNPVNYFFGGDAVGDVRGRLRVLAELQNKYSDKFSNFSVSNPEKSRVWEHFLDNTITRMVTSINYADNWQELTGYYNADPNQLFKHMYWMNPDNNTMTQFSVLLNSIFDLDPMSDTFGEKKENSLMLQNVSGTQLIDKYQNSEGTTTASMDATSKMLQEFHSMLLNGVEEFMRHASKNTAMGITLSDKVQTYDGKKSQKLYVDVQAFMPGRFGEDRGTDIMVGYLSGEVNRILRYNTGKYSNLKGYNRTVTNKLGQEVDAGSALTAFDDVLSYDTQEKIYQAIKDIESGETDSNYVNFKDYLESNIELLEVVRQDIQDYFDRVTEETNNKLSKSSYVDQALLDKVDVKGYTLSPDELQEILVKAYVYNSWIHKFETTIIAYGDAVQYNHAKEEFHKRNAGLGAGGRSFRSDIRAQMYINDNSLFKRYYAERLNMPMRRYNGTLNTAIIKELEEDSTMYAEYRKHLESVYYSRIKNRAKAKELAETAMDEYLGMKVGDGQGYITFESYRMLKKLENNWTDNQERLYKKVALGEKLAIEDLIEYFPPYKLQYFGNIQNKGLPVTSFHKFSLAPLIPEVAKENSPLHRMHMKMMEQEMDYVTFESGSKVSHIGSGDVIMQDGKFNEEVEFTKNVIFAEYLKNQTEVNASYKGKSIFSTQMRKLILEGLYTQGAIDTTDESKITSKKVKRYLDHVSDYTELLKYELLEEIGYKEDGKDNFVPKGPGSTGKLINLIRTNLEREDVLSDNLIEFIDVFDSGELRHDTSFHPDAAKIEKVLLSVINKRIIKPKIKGEPLVQKSSALYDIDLPTYYRDKRNGNKTAAMKVAIAMQGDYYNLFNLKYAERPGSIEYIGVTDEDGNLDIDASLARLNEKIKNDVWLDANKGANRKAITLVGVRIPVQGLNSMEFAEVYEFLAPQASNIVVVPKEIVAKSGGDFDIDKLTFFMNNLDAVGKVVKPEFSNTASLKEDIAKNGLESQKIKTQKAGLENEMINDIREILEMPHNYASLITPNGTFLLKGIAEKLSKKVMEYNPNTVLDKDGKKVDIAGISPTRIFEPLYNLYKHESNAVGKRTLGLGAVENTFNVIMNAAGAKMPEFINVGKNKSESRKVNMYLRHNKFGDTEQISLSNQFDVDGVNKIADVISQMMNGWVDVEKDAWIFFIQGNYEVAPQLLYLVKAGVPVEEAIYFVSNPLVREYVEEQRLAKSTFAPLLGTQPDSPAYTRRQASSKVIARYFKDKLSGKSKNAERHKIGEDMIEDLFKGRRDKNFTLSEMESVINKNDKTSNVARAMFLHYLSLEAQVGGLTAVKLTSNPDTSTKSTISDVEQTEADLDAQKTGDHAELLESFMNDSVISSFFNGPLSIALSKSLFNLRFNKAISDYLIVKDQNIKDNLIPSLFPGGNKELFSTIFRNDLVSFLFQNELRKYKLGDTYTSFELKKSFRTKRVESLSRGAFVKDGVMYVDERVLQDEFLNKDWAEDSDSDNSYEERGLFPLNPGTFMRNEGKNFNEYLKFVLERESLRDIYPIAELSKTPEFERELEKTEDTKPNLGKDKQARYTYEKMISHMALENTMNIYHMFLDPDYATAIRFTEIMAEFPNLKSKYEVLQRLQLDTNENQTVFNLYIADKDFNNDKSNLYTKNLEDLANPGVVKVMDRDANMAISRFFNHLKLYAFMQTGLNKEKLSITNVVDYTPFVQTLEQGENDLINTLNKNGNKFLDNFLTLFEQQNSKYNKNKRRFKDYLANIDYENPARIKDVPNPTEGRTDDAAILDEEKAPSNRLGLSITSRPGVFTYNDSRPGARYYNNLVYNNKDVVFIHNSTIKELQSDYTVDFGGQSQFVTEAEDMSIDIPTGQNAQDDGMADTPYTYESIKELYERRINEIKKVRDSGVVIAFPETGFGKNLPQELFVYLSRRLFEEFGYLNPGSTQYDIVEEVVAQTQGISDAEILAQLSLEEDPFKC